MMTYTTALTVSAWANGESDTTPGYCDS
jgi:hypothetical protein